VVGRIARRDSQSPPLDWRGVLNAAAITMRITAGFTTVGVLLWWAGGAGLQARGIRAWIRQNKPTIRSPSPFAWIRGPD
jgi:hypothetical protein